MLHRRLTAWKSSFAWIQLAAVAVVSVAHAQPVPPAGDPGTSTPTVQAPQEPAAPPDASQNANPPASAAGPGASANPAATADPFTVRDIDVDVTAANAADARDQAIAEAQRKAFAVLYRRLTPPGSPQPPTLDETRLAQLVQGFEVQRERTSAVRYLATLSIRFWPNAVRNLFTSTGVAFTDARSRPVLVLPVVRSDGQPVLWEERTDWRDAWENLPPQEGLVPLVVPPGELADVSAITAEEALAGDQRALDEIAGRYGAAQVIVAVVDVPASGPDVGEGGRMLLRQYGVGSGRTSERTADIPAAPGRSALEYFTAGAAGVLAKLEQEWKQSTTFASRDQQQLQASVPIGRLDDWIQTRDRLAQVPAVVRTELVRLSREEAVVTLVYLGDPNRLKTALQAQDLTLTENPGAAMAVPGAFPASGVPSAGMPPQQPSWTLRWAGALR